MDAIKKATEEVQVKFYEISAKMYEQANPQAEGQPEGGTAPNGEEFVDADFKEVNDEDVK